MTLVALGSFSVGGAVPGCTAAVSAGVSGINGALPDILARLEALASFLPLPIDFGVQLTLAQSIVTSVQAGITAGLPVPDIGGQIAAVAALVASLLAQVAAVNAQLSILINLQAPLAAAGVELFAFDGARSALGAELATALGPSAAHANALALVTTDPSAWAAMGLVLKVS